MSTASRGSSTPWSREDLRARLPVDVLHDDEVAAVSSSRPKSKTCTTLGCTSRAAASASRRKRGDEARVLRQVLGEQLDRDVALQPRVEREQDRRHAAHAQAALELVAVGEELVSHHVIPRNDTAGVRWFHRRGLLGAAGSRSAVGVSVSGSPSASRSASRLVGVSVGVSVRRLGRRRRSPPACSRRRSALELVEPLLQVPLQSRGRPARQLGDLAAGVAQRVLRAVAVRVATCARRPGRPCSISWSARSCGISLGFELPQPASSRAATSASPRRERSVDMRGY